MAKPLAAILKRYSDVISGKKSAPEVEKLTLGKEPGVDYAPKMPDEREFVASHSVEKHPDVAGNGSDVYNGAKVKQAVDDRHGHIPNPKSKKQYTQANEEVNLAEAAPAVGSKHKVSDEGTIEPHVVTSVSDGVVHTQHLKNPKQRLSIPLRDWAGSSSPLKEEVELTEAKCNMTEAGKMCEVHGKKACPKEGEESASDKEPRYTDKKKEGRQLITDKKTISEVLTKKTSVGKVISDFEKSDDPRFKGDSKEKRKERALAAWYKMHPEKSKKKMKESAPSDTSITFPSGNSREGFKL